MCGGFTIATDIKKLIQRFKAQLKAKSFMPRYNARPSQNLPIILNTDRESIVFAYWGFHPKWSKTPSQQIINVRAESYNKFTFKKAFNERRCLILADGFFEWKKEKNSKQPYYFIRKDREPFAFAGVYQERGGHIEFTIITTEPNQVVEPIHDRMPAILLPEDEREWLNPDKSGDDVVSLLKPYPEELMWTYPISKRVNIPMNDSPELIKSLD